MLRSLTCFKRFEKYRQKMAETVNASLAPNNLTLSDKTDSKILPEKDENNHENQQNSEIYEASSSYWQTVEPTVAGMLGGFPELDRLDIIQSKTFLQMLQNKRKVGRGYALDCGAGIGRVTKNLLLSAFDSVDMVDVVSTFIKQSEKFLGAKMNARVPEKFVSGLQDFVPVAKRYDVIWVQWVSIYLTDSDFIEFFRRCAENVAKNGCVVLKENIASTDKTDFDTEDSSYTRPRSKILQLFEQAGLTVLADRKQTNFPKGMYEVRMIAVRK